MNIGFRNHVQVTGEGQATLVFVHGFGCDQTMWRFLAPHYAQRYRTVLYDLTGSGRSDHAAYGHERYASLHGHAEDLLEIVDAFASGPVVVVGHSVSAMIAMLATIKAPGRFAAQVMLGPSACYLNEGFYFGGFARSEIEELLATMEANYLDWSARMAPAIMGAPGQPELGKELVDAFCRNNPDIARHFARVTFLSDHREDAPLSETPALILQCSEDLIAPRTAGEFLQRKLPNATLRMIRNVGHCAHMSAPGACVREIDAFLPTVLG